MKLKGDMNRKPVTHNMIQPSVVWCAYEQTGFSLNPVHTLLLTAKNHAIGHWFLFISPFNVRQPFVFHISRGTVALTF